MPEARALDAPFPGFAQSAKVVGHALAPADPDGVVRWDDLGEGVSAARALAGLDCLRRDAERPAA